MLHLGFITCIFTSVKSFPRQCKAKENNNFSFLFFGYKFWPGPLPSDPGGLPDPITVFLHIHHWLSLLPRGHPAVSPFSTAPGRVPRKDNAQGLALKGRDWAQLPRTLWGLMGGVAWRAVRLGLERQESRGKGVWKRLPLTPTMGPARYTAGVSVWKRTSVHDGRTRLTQR